MTPTPVTLTRHQKNFFDTFGYLKVPGVLAAQVPMISDAFNSLYEQYASEVVDWKHEGHYMKSRRVLLQFIERRPELASLLEHPVILGIFESILGKDFLYRASEGNIFTGDTYWHSDLLNAPFRYQHVKILVYLEPLTADSGAFRAVPGSHHFGDEFSRLLDQFGWKHEEHFGLGKEELPHVVIPTEPGDLLVFDYRLKHATCHSQHDRRMFSICASERFGDADFPLLGKLMRDYLGLTRGQPYWPAFLEQAPASRRLHLQQCLDAAALPA